MAESESMTPTSINPCHWKRQDLRVWHQLQSTLVTENGRIWEYDTNFNQHLSLETGRICVTMSSIKTCPWWAKSKSVTSTSINTSVWKQAEAECITSTSINTSVWKWAEAESMTSTSINTSVWKQAESVSITSTSINTSVWKQADSVSITSTSINTSVWKWAEAESMTSTSINTWYGCPPPPPPSHPILKSWPLPVPLQRQLGIKQVQQRATTLPLIT